jgi:hypothetical protein
MLSSSISSTLGCWIRASDGEHLLLATGELSGVHFQTRTESREMVENLTERLFAAIAAPSGQLQVLAHAQAAEQGAVVGDQEQT